MHSEDPMKYVAALAQAILSYILQLLQYPVTIPSATVALVSRWFPARRGTLHNTLRSRCPEDRWPFSLALQYVAASTPKVTQAATQAPGAARKRELRITGILGSS
jgi:hypothetical protein